MDEFFLKKVKIIAIISSIIPLFFLFTLFIAVFSVLGLFKSTGSGGSSSGSDVVYESECNYEETVVTVMDGDNRVVLVTQSLEDYVIGVACTEVGFCDGNLKNANPEYVKANYVAIKTFVLANGGYNNSTQKVTVRASTRDQQWCHIEKGCYITETDDYAGSGWYFMNSYPGDYDRSKADGTIEQERSFTEEDIELARKYYKETYGDLILSTSYKSTITSLGSKDYVGYKSTTQNYWKNAAISGKSYGDILKSTATAGVPNSENYVNKDIYKLSSYCKVIKYGSSGNASIDYVKWMIDFAADDSHGYSMANRTMNPDVDCSSFVYYALLNNGYTKSQLGATPFSTSSMDEILSSIGFEQISFNVNSLQEGDILWYPAGFNGHKYGHTEVYIGDGQTVGAKSNYDGIKGDGQGNEVSVGAVGVYKAIFRKK